MSMKLRSFYIQKYQPHYYSVVSLPSRHTSKISNYPKSALSQNMTCGLKTQSCYNHTIYALSEPVSIDYLPISRGGGKGGWLAQSQHLVILNKIYPEYSFVAMIISISNCEIHLHVAHFPSTLQENNIRKKLCFLAFLVLASSLLCLVNFRR